MKIAIIFVVILISLSALSSFSDEISISGKSGAFIFTSSDREFRENWAPAGYLIGGRISYFFNKYSGLSFDIEQIRSEKITHISDYILDYNITIRSQNLSVLMLYILKSNINSYIIPFIGSGFGINYLYWDIDDEYVSLNDSVTDFIYKALFGLEIDKFIVLEIGYESAGRNGNTGIFINGGLKTIIK